MRRLTESSWKNLTVLVDVIYQLSRLRHTFILSPSSPPVHKHFSFIMKKSICVQKLIWCGIFVGDECAWMCLVSLCVCVSLSHTHTHTHIYIHTHMQIKLLIQENSVVNKNKCKSMRMESKHKMLNAYFNQGIMIRNMQIFSANLFLNLFLKQPTHRYNTSGGGVEMPNLCSLFFP